MRGTPGQRGGWQAHDPGMFCSCTPEMYEPPMHAFSPHVSRGYVDQQNSQPVQWDALLEKIGMASGAVQFHEFFLHTVNEQPVRFDVAIPEGPPVPYQEMGPVSGVQLLASGQRFDNVI